MWSKEQALTNAEIRKMRNGEWPDFSDAGMQAGFKHAKQLLAKLRMMSTYDDGYRAVLEALIPGIPASTVICPPFHCDHGHGIILGEHVFINANCTFLDGAYIRIGAHTLIAPNVQIYTPHHPLDYRLRHKGREYAKSFLFLHAVEGYDPGDLRLRICQRSRLVEYYGLRFGYGLERFAALDRYVADARLFDRRKHRQRHRKLECAREIDHKRCHGLC